MSTRDEFYRLRDRRSVECGVDSGVLDEPVGMVIGIDAAETQSGQLCALAMANMLARVHRSIRVIAPDVALAVPSGTTASSLPEACALVIRRVDPFCDVQVCGHGELMVPECSVALGNSGPLPAIRVGARGFVGELGRGELRFSDYGHFHIGSGIAACLGSAALMRLVSGRDVTDRTVSFWSLSSEVACDPGPQGTISPLDVGDVWMVGAGAVGSAVAYWLDHPGVAGSWTIIDKDHVELHNTNRTLCLFPDQSGWLGAAAADKSSAVAAYLGGEAIVSEYGAWAAGYRGRLPDLVLPLANEDGVRSAVSELGLPLTLHAATGRTWEAHLHRHIIGRDDCIQCRLPQESQASFACATGPLPQRGDETSTDAALPFLSASAGLMLVAALTQLQLGGADAPVLSTPYNRHGLVMDLSCRRNWQPSRCACSSVCEYDARVKAVAPLHCHSRWASIADQR